MLNKSGSVLMVTRELAGDRRYGIGRSLMPVVDALSQRGWQVRYLCQEDLPEKARMRYLQWQVRWKGFPGIQGNPTREQLVAACLERWFMGWFAARVAQAEKYQTVHLHDPWLAFGFYVGVLLLRLRSVRWGLTEHGFGSYSRATHDDGLLQGHRAQRWLRRMEAWVLSKAHFVTAPTHLALQQLARDLALPSMPAHWVAIGHTVADVPTRNRSQARSRLGWMESDLVVLGVGRLVPLKRFDLLVDACAALASRYPQLRLVLLGDGDSQGLIARAELTSLAGRVQCLSVPDVWPYYAGADIYVSTSSTESFGLANFEALQSGLPCVCTAVGGVPEVMGEGAWLVPVDLDAVGSAVEALLGSVVQRNLWAQRAQARSCKVSDTAAIVDAYVAVYST